MASMIMGLLIGLVLVAMLILVDKRGWLHTHKYLLIYIDHKYAGSGNIVAFSTCYCGAYKVTPMCPDITKMGAKYDH
jgi:hypothetical protein